MARTGMIVETTVTRELLQVSNRLAELQLDLQRLLEVRDIARAAAANATPFHPANAAGTLAYQEGSWALRDRFVGKQWAVDRTEGLEAIKNDTLGIRVVFANVDIASHDQKMPKPRSPKGAGTERACQANLFGFELPTYAKIESGGVATYFLMVDEQGAAELTRPVVEGRTFNSYVERIYLSDGANLDLDILSAQDDDRADDFDPTVVRRPYVEA